MKYQDEKYYHVYNRGANRQNIFIGPASYDSCLRLLKKYLSNYGVSIMSYCLMPNHYHLLLRQNVRGSISGFLQTVFNAYTQAINLSTGHSGTLFQGRAKGLEIISDEYAVRLCRYIHYNPVAAGLVSKPEDWEYSDYSVWLGIREPVLSDLRLRDVYYRDPREYKTLMDEYVMDREIAELTLEGD
ncbi:MAG TPA: transposase [Candidatus Kryptonia bacterium]